MQEFLIRNSKWSAAVAYAGVVAPRFYLGISRLFIVKSLLSGIIKMSDIPGNRGFSVVRPQHLGCICGAFLHTCSAGKTWLPIFTESYLIRNQSASWKWK